MFKQRRRLYVGQICMTQIGPLLSAEMRNEAGNLKQQAHKPTALVHLPFFLITRINNKGDV